MIKAFIISTLLSLILLLLVPLPPNLRPLPHATNLLSLLTPANLSKLMNNTKQSHRQRERLCPNEGGYCSDMPPLAISTDVALFVANAVPNPSLQHFSIGSVSGRVQFSSGIVGGGVEDFPGALDPIEGSVGRDEDIHHGAKKINLLNGRRWEISDQPSPFERILESQDSGIGIATGSYSEFESSDVISSLKGEAVHTKFSAEKRPHSEMDRATKTPHTSRDGFFSHTANVFVHKQQTTTTPVFVTLFNRGIATLLAEMASNMLASGKFEWENLKSACNSMPTLATHEVHSPSLVRASSAISRNELSLWLTEGEGWLQRTANTSSRIFDTMHFMLSFMDWEHIIQSAPKLDDNATCALLAFGGVVAHLHIALKSRANEKDSTAEDSTQNRVLCSVPGNLAKVAQLSPNVLARTKKMGGCACTAVRSGSRTWIANVLGIKDFSDKITLETDLSLLTKESQISQPTTITPLFPCDCNTPHSTTPQKKPISSQRVVTRAVAYTAPMGYPLLQGQKRLSLCPQQRAAVKNDLKSHSVSECLVAPQETQPSSQDTTPLTHKSQSWGQKFSFEHTVPLAKPVGVSVEAQTTVRHTFSFAHTRGVEEVTEKFLGAIETSEGEHGDGGESVYVGEQPGWLDDLYIGPASAPMLSLHLKVGQHNRSVVDALANQLCNTIDECEKLSNSFATNHIGLHPIWVELHPGTQTQIRLDLEVAPLHDKKENKLRSWAANARYGGLETFATDSANNTAIVDLVVNWQRTEVQFIE